MKRKPNNNFIVFILVLFEPINKRKLGVYPEVGARKRGLNSIIEDYKYMFYMLNIDKLNDLFNSYYIIKYYFKYFS